jgi:hypothetical protein
MAKPTVKPDRDNATETNLARKIALHLYEVGAAIFLPSKEVLRH